MRKVIIGGAGQVGFQIARRLSAENYDVTVIDQDESLVAKVSDSLDLRGVVGHAALEDVDAALDAVSELRGALGTAVTSLSGRARALGDQKVQASSSESRLRDTDYAVEAAERVQQEIVAKGSLALITQANVSSSAVFTLVG